MSQDRQNNLQKKRFTIMVQKKHNDEPTMDIGMSL